MSAPEEKRPELDDAPPLLGTWRNIYLAVVGALTLYILGLWLFGKVYA